MHSFWHSLPVVNLISKKCNHRSCLNVFSTSSDIFSLFSNESGSYVVREEMEKMLHVVDGKVPESLKKCFSEVFYTGFILLRLQKQWKLHWGVSFSLTYTCLCMFGNKLNLFKLSRSSSFLVVILHVICIDGSSSLLCKCRHSPCFCSYLCYFERYHFPRVVMLSNKFKY